MKGLGWGWEGTRDLWRGFLKKKLCRVKKKMFVPALQASGRALTGIISELERTAGGAGRQTLGSDLNLRK